MAYLEVIVENGSGGPVAVSANGISLGKSKGFLAFLLCTIYPFAEDYVRSLEYVGWRLQNTTTSTFVGMVDGLPFGNSNTKLIFVGDGPYEVEWQDNTWNLKGASRYSYDDYDDDYYYYDY